MAAVAAIAIVIFAVPVSGMFGWHRNLIPININLCPNPDYSDFYKHKLHLNLSIHKNRPPELAPRRDPNISVQEELFQLCLKSPQTIIIVTLIPDEDMSLQDVVSQIYTLNKINNKVYEKWSANYFQPCPYGRILLSRQAPQVTSKKT